MITNSLRIKPMKQRKNLMNRRIHWISTNWTFKKFMDTGGAWMNNWRDTGVIIVGINMRLCTCRKLMMMVMDLILISQIRGWHTFNALQFHSHNKQAKNYQPSGLFLWWVCSTSKNTKIYWTKWRIWFKREQGIWRETRKDEMNVCKETLRERKEKVTVEIV